MTNEGVFMSVGKDMELKSPTTFKQQVELLKSRNLIIDDEEQALSMLQKINYYRLSAYMITLKTGDRFNDGVSLQHVHNLYQFDKKLRNLILPILESIEISFRTHIAYLIAHKYGAEGYIDCRNFKRKDYHEEMLQKLNDEIDNSREIFVEHHKQKYGGRFSVWVVIELTSFGLLSKSYSNLKNQDRNEIAQEHYGTKGSLISSWLHSLSILRNTCAHYGRLYNRKLVIAPRLFKTDEEKGVKNDRLFACLLIMGRLSLDKSEWSNFVTQLEALVEQYDEVNLECLGFPANWQTVLRKQ